MAVCLTSARRWERRCRCRRAVLPVSFVAAAPFCAAPGCVLADSAEDLRVVVSILCILPAERASAVLCPVHMTHDRLMQ